MGVVLAGLAMSLGWGIRGDYGHEAGAMIPGALLGLSICLASGRRDWWRRASLMGMCGAIGWAFGGQMSYGRIIGYTAASSLPDVLYGYACLFLVGGLWAGIGAAILSLSVTQPLSYLERFARPLMALGLVWFTMSVTGLTPWLAEKWSLNDTDWVGALSALAVAGAGAALSPSDRGACILIAVLAAGWWAGYLVLTVLFGLHMTPPRSDNWAGCIGLFAALLAYLHRRRDRAALRLGAYGFLMGGLGFVLGDFLQMLGRAQWGPVGRCEALQGLDYWKWMEQSFGLVMGLGIGAVFLGGVRCRLAPAEDGTDARGVRTVALVLLLVVMMWANLHKNVINWAKNSQIPPVLLGIPSTTWLLAIGVVLSGGVLAAILRHRQAGLALSPAGEFGRGQLLFLFVTWVPVLGALTQALPGMANRSVFLVHASFWLTAGVASWLVIGLTPDTQRTSAAPGVVSGGFRGPGRRFWLCVFLIPVFLYVTARLTVAAHAQPLPGSQVRFSGTPSAR
jgi:hypothetical protein